MWRCSADETQVHIAKHVLKTLCTDVTNILLNFLAADLMMSVENPAAISSEVRLRRPLAGRSSHTRTTSLIPVDVSTSGQSEDTGQAV